MLSSRTAAKISVMAAFCCGLALEAAMGAVRGTEAGSVNLRSAAAQTALVDEIVAQERAFAADTARRGMRDAFLTYLADDGVLFAPGPVRGKDHLAGGEPDAGNLSWTPAFAGMAASGDLAFTVGPYVWTDGKLRHGGQYLTIWSKGSDGRWRFELDRGTGGPRDGKATIDGIDVERLPISDERYQRDSAKDIVAAEASLGLKSKLDAQAALLAALAPAARVLRQGHEPAFTPGERASMIATGPTSVSFNSLFAKTSAAGDLAYTYGDAAWMKDGKLRQGHFVRVWQRQQGKWAIVVDSTSALPLPKKN